MVSTAAEFTNKIENMEVGELNKRLAKFYVSVRKMKLTAAIIRKPACC